MVMVTLLPPTPLPSFTMAPPAPPPVAEKAAAAVVVVVALPTLAGAVLGRGTLGKA